jgi:hypothetical protein
VLQVEGAPYPDSLTNAAVQSITLNRNTGEATHFPATGGAPAASPPGGAPAASPPAGAPPARTPDFQPNIPSLRTTSFPNTGETTPFGGTVSGVVDVENYKVALYVKRDGKWWLKPIGSTGAPCAKDGTFTISGWATAPVADGIFNAIYLYVVPRTFSIPDGKQLFVSVTMSYACLL